MKYQYAARAAALTLIVLFPLDVYSANKDAAEGATLSAEELTNVSERIRQTGAQMKEDLKQARARIEARKAMEEAERKREAELARQHAIQEAKQKQAQEAAQARARQEAVARAEQAERDRVEAERKQKLAAEKAEREKLLAQTTHMTKEEKAAKALVAKARAAEALKMVRESSGVKAFAE